MSLRRGGGFTIGRSASASFRAVAIANIGNTYLALGLPFEALIVDGDADQKRKTYLIERNVVTVQSV